MRSLSVRSKAVMRPTLLAGFLLATGCSDHENAASDEVLPLPQAPDAANGDAGLSAADASSGPFSSPPGQSVPDAGGMNFSVPSDSRICGTDLPFKPKGCPCQAGTTSACWTGPSNKRNVGACKDGVQKCESDGEFSLWGECKGEVVDCGDPPPADPPKEECKCIPGQVIGCDEDCAALVFCAPFSSKVCQPDGTFGPCRESLLPNLESNLCLNVFHGCFAENPDGLFIGDCNKPFTCGHPPGAPPPATPPTPPTPTSVN